MNEGFAAEHGAVGEISDPTPEERRQRQLSTFGRDTLKLGHRDSYRGLRAGCSDAEEHLSILRLGVAPSTSAGCLPDARPGRFVSRHRLGVAAKSILFRIRDEPGANAVQIDVGGGNVNQNVKVIRHPMRDGPGEGRFGDAPAAPGTGPEWSADAVGGDAQAWQISRAIRVNPMPGAIVCPTESIHHGALHRRHLARETRRVLAREQSKIGR